MGTGQLQPGGPLHEGSALFPHLRPEQPVGNTRGHFVPHPQQFCSCLGGIWGSPISGENLQLWQPQLDCSAGRDTLRCYSSPKTPFAPQKNPGSCGRGSLMAMGQCPKCIPR